MADENEVVPYEPVEPGTPGEEVAPAVTTSTYNWDTFNINEALGGALVGFENVNEDYDLSKTGVIERVGSCFKVTINGHVLSVDSSGVVYASSVANDPWINQRLQIVKAVMDAGSAIGGAITRSYSEGGTYSQVANVTTIEPRDQFAVQALNAMLVHVGHPEAFDDAKMLSFSRAAYRWAQAMMIAAADSRHGQSTAQNPPAVSVNPDDLQSNTEKLLYNMTDYMKNGVTIKGTTAAGTAPVQAEVKNLVQTDVQNLTDAFSVPEVTGDIEITASIFKSKYVRLEFISDMAYSDVSVYLTLTTNDGSRDIGYVIPKGSVVVVIPLDEDVTSITSIDSSSVRGQGGNDPNTYTFT